MIKKIGTMRLAPDGKKVMLIATVLLGGGGAACVWAALGMSALYWAPAGLLISLWVLTIAFFRDPQRLIPNEPGMMVSPADGRVTDVSRLDHHDLIGGPAIRISIFLSIFNVHINRASCAGRVVRTCHKPGAFLDARHVDSGLKNESNTIVLESEEPGITGPVIIRQIAGKVARRIVCDVAAGDILRRGQRLGMIKFGSRTELVVPGDGGWTPTVRVNDRVSAGTTVLLTMTNTFGKKPGNEGLDMTDETSIVREVSI